MNQKKKASSEKSKHTSITATGSCEKINEK